MTPEKPSAAAESAEQPVSSLRQSIDRLRGLYGTGPDFPEEMDSAEITDRLDRVIQDTQYDSASELFAYNRLVNRKNALQRQAEFDDPAQRERVDIPEFVVVKEAQTYFDYLDSILNRTLKTADQAMILRESLKEPSLEAQQLEREMQVYLDELHAAVDKRLTFSNATLASHILSIQRDRRGEVMRDQGTLLKQLDFLKEKMQKDNAAGLAALTLGDYRAMRIHSNNLDQKVVDLIAQKGDIPARLLLQLQTEKYEDVLNRQIASVKEGKEHAHLDTERRAVSGSILQTAEDLSEFHEEALVLTQIQHQFKSADLTLDATASNPDQTPEEVKKAISETMDVRNEFHRKRLRAFVDKFDEDVLTIGWPEGVEEFSNVKGREFVRVITNKLSALYTLPIPETAGARDAVRQLLSGQVNEAMGWPAEKMDLSFEELDSSEQEEVMKRARSVADAVREFNPQKIKNVRESIDLFAALPPASSAIGQPQPNPESLPDVRVTPENMQSLIDAHGLPAVYLMAARQLDEDMGSPAGGGFIGEVQIFTDKLESNIGVHLDVANAFFQSAQNWMTMVYAILATAGLTYLTPKLVKFVRKRLRNRTAPRTTSSQRAAPRTAPVERAPKPKLTPQQRVAKIAGHAGFLLAEFTAAAEILDSLHQTARAGQLDNVDTADAALELWQAADIAINGGSGAYSDETRAAQTVAEATGSPEWVRDERLILEQQRQLLIMKHILESAQVSQAVGNLGKQGRSLEQRRKDLLKQVEHLAHKRQKQLPFYRPDKHLWEQSFTRDGRTGGINVQTGGSNMLGIFPRKFTGGPIEQARTAGAEQRAKDKFNREKAQEEFEAVQSELWDFQGTLEGYLGDVVDFEEGIEK